MAAAGYDAARAQGIAALMVAAYEGGLLQATETLLSLLKPAPGKESP